MTNTNSPQKVETDNNAGNGMSPTIDLLVPNEVTPEITLGTLTPQFDSAREEKIKYVEEGSSVSRSAKQVSFAVPNLFFLVSCFTKSMSNFFHGELK